MISQLTYVFQLICSTKLFSSSLQRYFCIYFRFYSIPYSLSILHSVPFYFSYFLLSISTSFPLQLLLFSSNSLFFPFFLTPQADEQSHCRPCHHQYYYSPFSLIHFFLSHPPMTLLSGMFASLNVLQGQKTANFLILII